MEKTAYKILKKLYNSESISMDEINQLTKKDDSKPIKPNQPNKYVTYLKMDKMVTIFDEGGTDAREEALMQQNLFASL